MKTRLTLFIAPLMLLAGLAVAQKPSDTTPQKPSDTAPAQAGGVDAKVITFQKPSYPLTTCPISGEKLGSMGTPVDMVVDGRLVRLCCGNCKKGVEKDKAAVIKKIDDAVVAQQSVGYPMERCVICEVKMEKPVDHVVGTRLVRCCSAECVKAYDTDPSKSAKGMKSLDNAWLHSQKAKYAVTACPVCTAKLDADGKKAEDYMYGTKLIRVCSKECIKEFEKSPDVVLVKFEELKKAVPASAPKDKAPEKKPEEKKGG